MNRLLATLSCFLLVLGGCPQLPAQQGVLQPSQVNGSWEFIPDGGGQTECYTFDGGKVIYYSSFCDGVNDLRAETTFTLSVNDFSASFPATLTGVSSLQANVSVIGTVLDGDTIYVTVTASAGAASYSLDGVLRRQ